MDDVISGVIERGKGLGSSISYPTINIALPKGEARGEVRGGVYVCEVSLKGEKVFGAGFVGEVICEVFLFGEIGDVYGEIASIKLLKRIRDVQKVKNLEELKPLIANDVKFAKEWLNHLEN